MRRTRPRPGPPRARPRAVALRPPAPRGGSSRAARSRRRARPGRSAPGRSRACRTVASHATVRESPAVTPEYPTCRRRHTTGGSARPWPAIRRGCSRRGESGVSCAHPYNSGVAGVESTGEHPDVFVSPHGYVAELVLNRTAAHNALSTQLTVDITQALSTLVDDGFRAVVVSSSSTAVFCVGADLKERGRLDDAGFREQRTLFQ